MKPEKRKPASIQEFLGLTVRAGLINENDAKQLSDTLLRPSQNERIDVRELADRLVAAGLLTKWQKRNLLRGRWRGILLDDYCLLEPLGSGGVGVVYIANHLPSERIVAIKVLSNDSLENAIKQRRFEIEGRAASMLQHPNIVEIKELTEHKGQKLIVMEYVRGTNLQEYVAAHGPLSIAMTVDFAIQATEGLKHAHQAGMVHRDIKPLNLLIGIMGELKISDFGLARLLCENSQTLTIQQSGRILGTVDYLAPEQALDAHDVDGRADIYSLGCTIYFMLSGVPPFHSGNLAQRIAMHQSSPPPDLREIRTDIPDQLLNIINQMLAKDPGQRYSSADDLLKALRSTTQTQALPTGPPKLRHPDLNSNGRTASGMTSMDMLGIGP